ncbi:hypothetical protein GCM10027342_47760 [Photobacterium alginatilyticum]
MNYKDMDNMARLRSKLEIEINQFRLDGEKNGKNRKISIKELAGMVGFAESTLYLRWTKPETFQEDEIANIAKLLQIDITTAAQWSQEFEPGESTPITEPKYLSNRENRAISAEQATTDTSNSSASAHIKQKPLTALLLVPIVLLLGYLFLSSNSQQSTLKPLPTYSALYHGTAIDLNAEDVSRALNFHSKLYNYELKNLKTHTVGEDITLAGDIFWSHLKQEGEKHQQALFLASGKHVGDTVAIVYEITDEARSEMWIGTAVIHMPRSGPAEGYWLTLHNEEDPDAHGPYAIGSISLNR